jgi:hypothetical protein
MTHAERTNFCIDPVISATRSLTKINCTLLCDRGIRLSCLTSSMGSGFPYRLLQTRVVERHDQDVIEFLMNGRSSLIHHRAR